MTLRQLEIFVTIVDSGGFTRAAERLRVAQPSISQQIKQLEDELGERLIFRMRNQKMFLTEAGKVVKKHAHHILRQSDILRMEVASLTQDPVGEVYIGVGVHQLMPMVAPVLGSFHQKYPRVRVDITNVPTPQILDLLKNNRLDLGIVVLPVSDKELHTHVLFSEEMVVVVRKSDRLAQKRQIGVAEIGGLPLVLYDRNTKMRVCLDEFFRKEGISPTIVLELNVVETMMTMVEAGFGATIIPVSAINALPYRDILQPLRIQGRRLTREVGVATTSFPRVPKLIDELLRLIQERFTKFDVAVSKPAA
ncbi:MAG: LysR family transcriptional regulator [Acidobacteriia bacterium]|nr:LysR family transcriptional regulator [Terriglobia bacterium]